MKLSINLFIQDPNIEKPVDWSDPVIVQKYKEGKLRYLGWEVNGHIPDDSGNGYHLILSAPILNKNGVYIHFSEDGKCYTIERDVFPDRGSFSYESIEPISTSLFEQILKENGIEP